MGLAILLIIFIRVIPYNLNFTNVMLLGFISIFNVIAEFFLFLAIENGIIGVVVSIVSFNSIIITILNIMIDNVGLTFM